MMMIQILSILPPDYLLYVLQILSILPPYYQLYCLQIIFYIASRLSSIWAPDSLYIASILSTILPPGYLLYCPQILSILPPDSLYIAPRFSHIGLQCTALHCTHICFQLKLLRSLMVAGALEYEEFLPLLRTLEPALQISVKDLRSQVVREACVTTAWVGVMWMSCGGGVVFAWSF